MGDRLTRILILADLEGSSGCWSYTASSFLTDEWCQACLEMSRDVSMVVSALFEAGVKTIIIKDFHRTGYNLFPELIDSRATLISGYRRGPIPGIGSHYNAQAVMFLVENPFVTGVCLPVDGGRTIFADETTSRNRPI